jgi:hypothetical protein
MQRLRGHRLLSAALALWFPLATGGYAAVHRCPMHDMAMAGQGVAHGGHAGAGEHAAQQRTHCSCDCIGACCCAAPAAFTAAASAVVHTAPVSSLPKTNPVRAVERQIVDHLLPFATAPPTSIPS